MIGGTGCRGEEGRKRMKRRRRMQRRWMTR